MQGELAAFKTEANVAEVRQRVCNAVDCSLAELCYQAAEENLHYRVLSAVEKKSHINTYATLKIEKPQQ